MQRTDWILRLTLMAIALFLGAIALRTWVAPETRVRADSGRFDYVSVVAPQYFFKGQQGVLLLDKRNGNVWFIPKGNDIDISFRDPVFVVHVPLEKLDER